MGQQAAALWKPHHRAVALCRALGQQAAAVSQHASFAAAKDQFQSQDQVRLWSFRRFSLFRLSFFGDTRDKVRSAGAWDRVGMAHLVKHERVVGWVAGYGLAG